MKFFIGRFLPFWTAFLATVLFWTTLLPETHPYMKFAVFAVPALWAILASRRTPKELESEEKKRGFWRRWGRRLRGEYAQFWYANTIFWLLIVHWVSYPHPATTLGWLVLSAYLGCYLPLFIGLCRGMNRLFRAPIWLVSPICWVACEWARNRILGGFSFGGLPQALYDVPNMIQIAEPLAEYGVSATISLVGALVGCAFVRRVNDAPSVGGRASVRLVSLAAIFVLATILYGNNRLSVYDALEADAIDYGRPTLKIGLMQDCTQYHFPPPRTLNKDVSDKYRALALKAAREEEGGFDLIVWPEGCYYGFFYDTDRDYRDLVATILPDVSSDSSKADPDDLARRFPDFYRLEGKARDEAEYDHVYARNEAIAQRRQMARLTSKLGCAAILGMASAVFHEVDEPTTYNSAVYVPYFGDAQAVSELDEEELSQAPTSSLVVEESTVFRRYDKIHLVMFGEYIPFLKYLPDSWEIKSVCAESILGRGRGPTAVRVSPRGTQARFILAPNVCFESVIPQFVKNQIRELRAGGADPDILVNVSHDGWFRCGVETDMHLATHVYRAIENRRSVVTATHGGFSAWIDPAGRIRAKGKRGNTEVVTAEICVVKGRRQGLYGDFDLGEEAAKWCAWLAFGAWFVSLLWTRFSIRTRKDEPDETTER